MVLFCERLATGKNGLILGPNDGLRIGNATMALFGALANAARKCQVHGNFPKLILRCKTTSVMIITSTRV